MRRNGLQHWQALAGEQPEYRIQALEGRGFSATPGGGTGRGAVLYHGGTELELAGEA